MKTNRYIATLLAIIGIASGSFAQTTATADISATIVNPISISKVQDMNFGKMAIVSGAGNVVLSPSANKRMATGGVELVDGNQATFASFNVSGLAGATFSITLPTVPVVISNGENTMTVSNFTSTPTNTATLGNGTKNIAVGATLHVEGNQKLGVYKSTTPFTVTVNYN